MLLNGSTHNDSDCVAQTKALVKYVKQDPSPCSSASDSMHGLFLRYIVRPDCKVG